VYGPEDTNDWFDLVPERLVERIAAIPANEVAAIAARWTSVDEGEEPIEDAEVILARLVPFCGNARAGGRRVYLWGPMGG
jgi:hypothetical protein